MIKSVVDKDSRITPDNVQLPTPVLVPVKSGVKSNKPECFDTTLRDQQHVASDKLQSANTDGMKKTPTPPRPSTWDKRSNDDEERIGPTDDTPRKCSSTGSGPAERQKIVKLSSETIQELTPSPLSLPLRAATPNPNLESLSSNADAVGTINNHSLARDRAKDAGLNGVIEANGRMLNASDTSPVETKEALETPSTASISRRSKGARPVSSTRAVSTPSVLHKDHSIRRPRDAHPTQLSASRATNTNPTPLHLQESKLKKANGSPDLKLPTSGGSVASPKAHTIPLPPLSLATYLQLELSSDRPSVLHIHRDSKSDVPYESSRVKFERLLNFLLLPPELEQILWFGALACLDAWLYTFTILPLRFVKALTLFIAWWARNAAKEAHDLASSLYRTFGSLWRSSLGRRLATVPSTHSRSRSATFPQTKASSNVHPGDEAHDRTFTEQQRRHRRSTTYRHRRTKSTPSLLSSNHKADLLKGCLIFGSCAILMRFDASRMYHGIRGQAAIKLYVIYNVLEVGTSL